MTSNIADKPRRSLSHGIEGAFGVVGFATVLANRLMPVRDERDLAGVPEIAERVAALDNAAQSRSETTLG